MPAAAAGLVFGATPSPSTTRSAGTEPPSVTTAPGSNPVTWVPSPHVDAVTAHGVAHHAAHVGVERAHHLGTGVDDGDRRRPTDERLGHLEADVAATDDDDVAALAARRSRGARRRRRASARRRPGRCRCPGASGGGRLRPGRWQQVVEADPDRSIVLAVAHLDLAPVDVDRRRLVPKAHVDPVALAQLLGASGDQVGDPCDLTRRRGTGCRRPIARVVALLEGDDVEIGPQPPGLGGRGHAPGIATDHHEPLSSETYYCIYY